MALERTIPRLVLGAADRFGSASALEDGDARFSFEELARAGLAVGKSFVAAGIGPGDRVGIWAPNIHEWILAAIGCQCAGGVVVTMNTRMKGTEAAYTLRKSGARLLLTMSRFLGVDYAGQLEGQELPELERTVTFRGATDRTTNWNDFLADGAAVDDDSIRERALAVAPDDLSDFLFTSGTTGHPKAVMSSHGQSIEAFEVWSEVVGLREGDRYLIINPFFHSFGYKAGWLACLIRGATILPQLTFDVPDVLRRVSEDRVSVLPGPPTIFQSLIAHPDREDYDLSNLRLAVTGAAPTPVELIRQMRDVLGFDSIVRGYGLTECTGIVSMCRYDDPPEVLASSDGRPIPGTEVKLVDSDGEEVPTGEPGEVWVRGYNVMQGYFDDEEETRQTIDADGWLHTGDIAVMDERGDLRITDRIKDMYISGGLNCYPAEIESLMFGSGLFAQVAVIGIPDERMGEVGMAWCVPAPGAGDDLDEAKVIAWCREHMANYKVPRRVALVDALPQNASGKVLKNELRERAAAGG